MRILATLTLITLISPTPLACRADLVISSIGSPTVIDFDTTVTGSNNGAFTGGGFSPSPGAAGRLDSNAWATTGWSDGSVAFGQTFTGGSSDFNRGASAGGETVGGIYGFDIDNNVNTVNRALGVQPGGSDFTPGSLTLRVQNNTGFNVTSWAIGYDIFTLNNEARSSSFNFSFSTNGTTFTSVASLNFTSLEAADASPAAWTLAPRSTTLAASVANEGQLFLRWTGDDVAGSGARDEFALDNVSITAVPEPSAFLLAGLICCVVGAIRARQRLTLSQPTPSKG